MGSEMCIRDSLAQLVVGVHLPVLVVLLDGALGAVAVGRGDCRAHAVQGQPVLAHGIRVEVDPHRRQRAAADAHLPYPLHLRQLRRQHSRGEVVHLAATLGLRGQGEDHDRHVRGVGLAVAGIVRHTAGQQAHRAVDRRLHLAGGAVDVLLQVEHEHHGGRAQRTAGGHLADPGDPSQRALQRRGHRRGHGFRAGARQAGADHDGRKIDVGQRRHRQQAERQGAGQQQRQGQQRGGDRAADEGRGQTHRPASPSNPASVFRSSPRCLRQAAQRRARRSK
ncbi:hypothetical protein PAERUG_P64_East_of_England_6_01_14_01311 [Pseudomonas aeruginosa]|nr:hypothetical protein PAERUG_P64_East_of_England_6_01_14_01311 [Pseudomonas aeruginosa]